MDRYIDIKEKILNYAGQDKDIKAIIAIGSSAREEVKADEYSDLDLIIVCENTEKWYSGEYPKMFGDMKISFIEPTFCGGRERRCIYDGYRDVDMIIFTQERFDEALTTGAAGWVMNRGYEILYDTIAIDKRIAANVQKGHSTPNISAEEFENMINDFYFHTIWARKKLLRGELWSAKMCVDAYLKNYLLKAIELYCYEIEEKDVWHDGRFIDTWAGEHIINKLSKCFAGYNEAEVSDAIINTRSLFEELTRAIAAKKGYEYPDEAAECAKAYHENSHTRLSRSR